MLIIADDNEYIGAERFDFLTKLIDGAPTSAPLGPFYFVSFARQFRFVRQIFTGPILQQMPMIRVEHQLWSVGHAPRSRLGLP